MGLINHLELFADVTSFEYIDSRGVTEVTINTTPFTIPENRYWNIVDIDSVTTVTKSLNRTRVVDVFASYFTITTDGITNNSDNYSKITVLNDYITPDSTLDVILKSPGVTSDGRVFSIFGSIPQDLQDVIVGTRAYLGHVVYFEFDNK